MANKTPKTRHHSGDKYAGDFCELPIADFATHRQVIQACYYEKHIQDMLSSREVAHIVAEKLKKTWSNANPRIIKLADHTILNKVEKLYKQAVDINNKKAKAHVKQRLDMLLDRLFDLASCKCDLPIVSCQDVKCKTSDCARLHIQCNCPIAFKVTCD